MKNNVLSVVTIRKQTRSHHSCSSLCPALLYKIDLCNIAFYFLRNHQTFLGGFTTGKKAVYFALDFSLYLVNVVKIYFAKNTQSQARRGSPLTTDESYSHTAPVHYGVFRGSRIVPIIFVFQQTGEHPMFGSGWLPGPFLNNRIP